ncbi:MAG: flagellar hook-associated protein 3 [Spirochaetia bacterium]
MNRVSSNMASMDAQYNMMLREWKMNQMQNKMGAQTRIKDLRDDPLAAARSTRLQSQLFRMGRYKKNIELTQGNLNYSESRLTNALEVLQRVRELSVQGANGVYSKDQMRDMAVEVNQLLEQLVSLANSRNGMGNTVFSGFESHLEPFLVMRGRVEGSASDFITALHYRGDIGKNMAEVSENTYVQMNIPGNQAFWAENSHVYANVDATTYQVQADSTIRIDGVAIDLEAGDNISAIIHKINEAPLAVRARLDPVKDSLVLETTTPHGLWMEDVGTGTVLQDLGILQRGRSTPPYNIADTANVFGGSIFDMVMAVRDSLYKGDSEGVNKALGGMDLSIESVTSSLAKIGSLDSRLRVTAKRLDYEEPEVVKLNAEDVDLDVTQAITELKMLEYTHQAALATSARVLRPTLLDFLR